MNETRLFHDLSEVVYSQYNVFNYDYFKKHYDKYWDISANDFPHTRFLRLLESGAKFDTLNNFYTEFLQDTFKYSEIILTGGTVDIKASIKIKTLYFIELFKKIKKNPSILLEDFEKGINACQRKDGKFALIHGNHRVAIAAYLKKPIKIHVSDNGLAYVLRRLEAIYAGPKPTLGVVWPPYQSVFDGEVEILKGRRTDMKTRFDKIRSEDIVGQRILELGSNMGTDLFLALQNGAEYGLGVEASKGIVNAGLKMNTYLAQNIDFLVGDLNKDLTITEAFDTIFCFSVAGYVKDWTKLVQLLLSVKPKVMYFEGHIGKKQDDYKAIFKYFKNIEFLGYNQDKDDPSICSRPFFRMEAK
jgi:hypothetical protein